MPSANMTCKEHGFCQHTSMWVCDQCAPKISGTQSTDVQQLKAEIASYADRLFELSRGGGELMPVMGVVNRLRQLSAV